MPRRKQPGCKSTGNMRAVNIALQHPQPVASPTEQHGYIISNRHTQQANNQSEQSAHQCSDSVFLSRVITFPAAWPQELKTALLPPADKSRMLTHQNKRPH